MWDKEAVLAFFAATKTISKNHISTVCIMTVKLDNKITLNSFLLLCSFMFYKGVRLKRALPQYNDMTSMSVMLLQCTHSCFVSLLILCAFGRAVGCVCSMLFIDALKVSKCCVGRLTIAALPSANSRSWNV